MRTRRGEGHSLLRTRRFLGDLILRCEGKARASKDEVTSYAIVSFSRAGGFPPAPSQAPLLPSPLSPLLRGALRAHLRIRRKGSRGTRPPQDEDARRRTLTPHDEQVLGDLILRRA